MANSVVFEKLSKAQLRDLTEAEIDAVFGGDGYGGNSGPPIVVTAPGTGSGTGNGGGYSLPPGGTGSTGGGGTGSTYESSSASAAGNAFADAHLRNHDAQNGEHDFDLAHDALAKLYDKAQVSPNTLITLGDGTSITAAQAVADLKYLTFDILNTGGGPTGAQTLVYSGSQVTIGLNPESSNMKFISSHYGDQGMNYTIFHELGHAINEISHGDASEASADKTGASLSGVTGIPQMNL